MKKTSIFKYAIGFAALLFTVILAVSLLLGTAASAENSFDCPGMDVNRDGLFNITDITTTLNMLSSSQSAPNMDANGDGRFDISDITAILNMLSLYTGDHQYEWRPVGEDHTSQYVCLTCGKIAQTKGTVTNVSDISKIYDGKAVEAPTYTTNNPDGRVRIEYYMKGSEKAIPAPVNAGEYTVKICISEANGISSAEASCDFVISKAVAVYHIPESLHISSGAKLREIDLSEYNLTWLEPNTVVEKTGYFSATVSLDGTNYYTDHATVEILVNVSENFIEKPQLNCSFEYDGKTHAVTVNDIIGFDGRFMKIAENASVLSASKIGTYTVTVSLTDKKNTCWADGSTTDVVLTWHIGSFKVTCESGTPDCYTVESNENGETTVVFTAVSGKSVYSISGELNGNIVIDTGDNYKFELSLCGVTLTSAYQAPIVILSGDEVSVTAKNGYNNYIYDKRNAVTDENAYSSCIYSKVDLVLGGKGCLTLVSDNNNGVHTKDDLEVKNLTLNITCIDNALKGNDSVTVRSGKITLIAKKGDGIKTTNTDLSSKGNQRGTVSILDGEVTVYAACDGIDAAYNVEVSGGMLNIFTDKYSEYSENVTAVSSGIYYIRRTSKNYNYSIRYYNDNGDFVWKNAEYYTSKQSAGGRPGQSSTYYYYKIEKPSGYNSMTLYVYNAFQTMGQDQNYTSKFNLAVNDSYDTISVGTNSVSFTNYTTASTGGFPGGRPGMNDGNTDKGDYSTKGLKADNEILISGGTVNIKSYDDAIHANSDATIQSTGTNGTGNVTVSGGTLTLYSNDDGIHADGILTVKAGTVRVVSSYEGLEGVYIRIEGGETSVISKDDGLNATTTSGEGIVISGGTLYVCAGGDGLDSNSRTSYDGILFAGGKTVVINTSGGNSPIDTEAGYKYTGGYVVAIGSGSGMWNESIKCNSSNGFSSVGCYKSNLPSAAYIVIENLVTVKMPNTMSSVVIVLGNGSSNSIISGASTSSETPDQNGVCWKV